VVRDKTCPRLSHVSDKALIRSSVALRAPPSGISPQSAAGKNPTLNNKIFSTSPYDFAVVISAHFTPSNPNRYFLPETASNLERDEKKHPLAR